MGETKKERIANNSGTHNILVVCSGNTCRSVTLMFLLRNCLSQLEKSNYAVHSRATRWEKPERMREIAQRAVVRVAQQLEILSAQPDLSRVLDVKAKAEGHITRGIATFDPRTAAHVFAMQRSHAEGVNHELERLGAPTRPIVSYANWQSTRSPPSIAVLDVPDDAWEFANGRKVTTLAGDADRAVSYEYDRQAETLALFAKSIAIQLP